MYVWVYFSDSQDYKDDFQGIVYQLWKSFASLKDEKRIASWIYSVPISVSKIGIDNKMRFDRAKKKLKIIWDMKNNIVKETKISSKKELNKMILQRTQKTVYSLHRLTLLGFISGGFMLFLIIPIIYRSGGMLLII